MTTAKVVISKTSMKRGKQFSLVLLLTILINLVVMLLMQVQTTTRAKPEAYSSSNCETGTNLQIQEE